MGGPGFTLCSWYFMGGPGFTLYSWHFMGGPPLPKIVTQV